MKISRAIVNSVAGACGPGLPGPQAGVGQSSTCSEMLGASSTSIPRYRTVLSSFVWPSEWASYYASPFSLKIKGPLRTVRCYRSRRAVPAGERRQSGGFDDPGSAGADLSAFDVAATEHAQRRHIADADDFGGGLQRDLATLGPFAIATRRNVPVFAEPAHAGLARCHLCSGPVQQARDLPIRHQTSQLAHERNQIVCDRIVAPAGCVQLDAQLQCRVIATVPAQDHVEHLAVLAHDDLV